MKHNKQLQIIVASILIFIFLSGVCLAGFFKVAGDSMKPTLNAGTRIWVSSYAKNTSPARGDIIVYKFENKTYLKRVIGLSQEKVIIKDGAVYIVNQANPQGVKLDEPYLAEEMVTQSDKEFLVPEGENFVLGDNRNYSLDSRNLSMGCIPRKDIIGKVTKIF